MGGRPDADGIRAASPNRRVSDQLVELESLISLTDELLAAILYSKAH